MIEYATGEQMHTLGLAMHTHPLTEAEAVELTERVKAMPVIPTVLRGPVCDAWPYSSWPSRTRRHRDAH